MDHSAYASPRGSPYASPAGTSSAAAYSSSAAGGEPHLDSRFSTRQQRERTPAAERAELAHMRSALSARDRSVPESPLRYSQLSSDIQQRLEVALSRIQIVEKKLDEETVQRRDAERRLHHIEVRAAAARRPAQLPTAAVARRCRRPLKSCRRGFPLARRS